MSNSEFKTVTLKNDKDHIVIVQDMVHIAPQKFYDLRNKEWDEYVNEDYDLLIEGVQNVPEEYKKLNEVYSTIGDILGFKLQNRPKKFICGDIDYEELPFFYKEKFDEFLEEISINDILKQLNDIKKFCNKIENLDNKFSNKIYKKVINKIINILSKRIISQNSDSKKIKMIKNYEVILDYRNNHVFNKSVKHNKNVVLPWGKAHSRGIIELLTNNGYSIQETTSIDMKELL